MDCIIISPDNGHVSGIRPDGTVAFEDDYFDNDNNYDDVLSQWSNIVK